MPRFKIVRSIIQLESVKVDEPDLFTVLDKDQQDAYAADDWVQEDGDSLVETKVYEFKDHDWELVLTH